MPPLFFIICGGVIGALLAALLSTRLNRSGAMTAMGAAVLAGTIAGYLLPQYLSADETPQIVQNPQGSGENSTITQDISEELATLEQRHPRLALIREHDPAMYAGFKRDISALLADGQTLDDVSDALPLSLELAIRKKLPAAPEPLLISELEISRDTFAALETTAPGACHLLLSGKKVPNLTQALPDELNERRKTQTENLIRQAPAEQPMQLSESGFRTVQTQLQSGLSETYGAFDPEAAAELTSPEEMVPVCEQGREYFSMVLDLPEEQKIPFARRLFSL